MAAACNRVTPTGDIESFPLRGAFTGNRGILHSGRSIVRFHGHNCWITCGLTFNGRWNEQWQPRRFTWLYFYDEALSFAAGHRPCAECRWRDYTAYRRAWGNSIGTGELPSAGEMNRRLHAERLHRGTHRRRTHELDWSGLPDGTYVLLEREPHVVVAGHLAHWTREGYRAHRPRPARGPATVLTPPSTVAVLAAGYPVQIDGSATA